MNNPYDDMTDEEIANYHDEVEEEMNEDFPYSINKKRVMSAIVEDCIDNDASDDDIKIVVEEYNRENDADIDAQEVIDQVAETKKQVESEQDDS